MIKEEKTDAGSVVVTAPRWPAPGTTFGPDRLDEVRALLQAWPCRGVWMWIDPAEPDDWVSSCTGYYASEVEDGQTWYYVGPHPSDPPDTRPAEPEPARTVVVRTWEFVRRCHGGAWELWSHEARGYVEERHAASIDAGWECGPIVAVDRALPLPIEPAVVVGSVVPVEVSDGE